MERSIMEQINRLLEDLHADGGEGDLPPKNLERVAARLSAAAVRLRRQAYEMRASEDQRGA